MLNWFGLTLSKVLKFNNELMDIKLILTDKFEHL